MGRDKNPRIAADTLSSPLAGKPSKDIGKAKPTKGAKPEIQPNISLVKQAAAPVIDAKAQKKREQHEANKAAQAPKKPKEVKEEENEMLKAAMEAHKRAKSQTHEVHQHFEKHDKTVLSAFAIFQKRETERLRAETPGLRPTQYKSKVQKLWIKNNKNKSSRNPKR